MSAMILFDVFRFKTMYNVTRKEKWICIRKRLKFFSILFISHSYCKVTHFLHRIDRRTCRFTSKLFSSSCQWGSQWRKFFIQDFKASTKWTFHFDSKILMNTIKMEFMFALQCYNFLPVVIEGFQANWALLVYVGVEHVLHFHDELVHGQTFQSSVISFDFHYHCQDVIFSLTWKYINMQNYVTDKPKGVNLSLNILRGVEIIWDIVGARCKEWVSLTWTFIAPVIAAHTTKRHRWKKRGSENMKS